MGILFSMWTVLVAVLFIGIVIWVLREDKEQFDDAAQIPFQETELPLIEKESRENDRG